MIQQKDKVKYGTIPIPYHIIKTGIISLNLNLVKAPEDVIDYIILHELCHLKIKEHTHHYWDLVHRFMPNYQVKIEWLNANGRNLIG
jgi:predicted metal-dependent hydrolase